MSEISQKSEISFNIPSGQRLTSHGATEMHRAKKKSLKKEHKKEEIKLLDLEYQNQVLLGKVVAYQRYFSKQSDIPLGEIQGGIDEIHLNYNDKTNYVNALQNKIAQISNDMEVLGKQQLLDRIWNLETQNTDLKERCSELDKKYIKVKQKCFNLSAKKKEASQILDISKFMRNAIQEFKKLKKISSETLDNLDLNEYDTIVRSFEDHLRDEKKNNKNPNLESSKQDKAQTQELKAEIAKKNHSIKGLQERVNTLSFQIEQLSNKNEDKEIKMIKDFEKQMDQEKDNTRKKIDEISYKYNESKRKTEEEYEGLRNSLTEKVQNLEKNLAKSNKEKNDFSESLKLKDAAFDNLSKICKDLKEKLNQREDDLSKAREAQRTAISQIQANAMQASMLNKSMAKSIMTGENEMFKKELKNSMIKQSEKVLLKSMIADNKKPTESNLQNQAQIKKLEKQVKDGNIRIAELETLIEENDVIFNEKLKTYKNTTKTYEQKMDDMNNKIEELSEKLAQEKDANKTITKQQLKIENLKQVIEELTSDLSKEHEKKSQSGLANLKIKEQEVKVTSHETKLTKLNETKDENLELKVEELEDKIEELNGKIKKTEFAQKQLEKANEEILLFENQIRTLKDELVKEQLTKKRLEKSESKINELRNEIDDLNKLLLEEQIKVQNLERITFGDDFLKDTKDNLIAAEMEKILDEERLKLAEVNVALNKYSEMYQTLEKELKNEKLRTQKFQNEKEKIGADNAGLFQQIKIGEKKVEDAKSDVKNLTLESQKLKSEVESLTNQVKDLKNSCNSVMVEAEVNKEKIGLCELHNATLLERLRKIEEEQRTLKNEHLSLKNELSEKNATEIENIEKIKHLEKTESELGLLKYDNSLLQNRHNELLEKFNQAFLKDSENEKLQNQLTKEILEWKGINNELEKNLVAQKSKYKKKIQTLRQKDLRTSNVEPEKNILENSIKDKNQKINNLNQDNELKKNQMKILQKRIESLESTISDKNEENTRLKSEVYELLKYRNLYNQTKESIQFYEKLKIDYQELLFSKNELDNVLENEKEMYERLELEFKEYHADVCKNDKTNLLSNLKAQFENLEKNLIKIEKERDILKEECYKLKSKIDDQNRQLDKEKKEREGFDQRMTEVEELILKGRTKKFGMSYDTQVADQHIKSLIEENKSLIMKIVSLSLKNEEAASQIKTFESRMKEMTSAESTRLSLKANLETKDQQIFEMVLNSNAKQTELQDLKNKLEILQDKLEKKTKENKKANEQTNTKRVSQVKKPNDNQKNNIIYSSQNHLTNAFDHAMPQGNDQSPGKPTSSGKNPELGTDALQEALEDNQKFKELKQVLFKANSELSLMKNLVETNLEKDKTQERNFQKLEQKLSLQQRTINDNAFLIQELQSSKKELEMKILRLKSNEESMKNELIRKEKDLLKTYVVINQNQSESNSNSVLLKIYESKISTLELEKENLNNEKQELSLEVKELTENAFTSFNDVLVKLNEEKTDHLKTKTEVINLTKQIPDLQKTIDILLKNVATKVDEIAKLKIQLNHQNDRIEVLIRVNRMDKEEFKDLTNLSSLQLEKELNLKRINDLEIDKNDLETKFNEANKDLLKLRKESEKNAMVLNGTQKYNSEIENQLIETRKKLIDKNNLSTKLQSENLALIFEKEKNENEVIRLKLSNSDFEATVAFLSRQIEEFTRKLNVHFSYVDREIQVDEHELMENDSINEKPKTQGENEKLLREFRRKIKVKNDQIQNLTENLEILQKQAQESENKKEYIRVEDSQVIENKNILISLKQKVIDLEKIAQEKEIYENELMDLIEEKRANEQIRNQLIENLKKEAESQKQKADDMTKDMFKNQEMMSKYLLDLHRLREETKDKNQSTNELKEQKIELENELAETKKIKAEIISDYERLQSESETKQAINNQIITELKNDLEKMTQKVADIEMIINEKLSNSELATKYQFLQEKEMIELQEKVKQMEEMKSEIRVLTFENEKWKSESHLLQFKLDEMSREVEFLKQKLKQCNDEFDTSKETIGEQEYTISLLSSEIERINQLYQNDIQTTKENHNNEVQKLNLIIDNQREILKKNYKAYASRINNCSKEIKALKKQINPDEQIDREQELKTSILFEELFEKEQYFEIKGGSKRNLETVKNEIVVVEETKQEEKKETVSNNNNAGYSTNERLMQNLVSLTISTIREEIEEDEEEELKKKQDDKIEITENTQNENTELEKNFKKKQTEMTDYENNKKNEN